MVHAAAASERSFQCPVLSKRVLVQGPGASVDSGHPRQQPSCRRAQRRLQQVLGGGREGACCCGCSRCVRCLLLVIASLYVLSGKTRAQETPRSVWQGEGIGVICPTESDVGWSRVGRYAGSCRSRAPKTVRPTCRRATLLLPKKAMRGSNVGEL
eukprot:3583720-Rhodomonas_salina.3